MEYVHRVTTVSGWAAALSSPEFPAATVLLACLGTDPDAVASIVRTCRAVGSLVVVDASRHDERTVRAAVAAGARRWDGSVDTAPSAFAPEGWRRST